MSKTVDERVVEMRFDNKQFESNVQTTMSSIDKLKEKLKFSGASKGLEELNSISKKTDLSGISKSADAVRVKFSAMQIAWVTALANITNSALNAGKRIMSALTIDPIKTGFQEYETQINSVQTILANTQSKGSTINDVNKALDELNKYADLTIYNFTEMTRNIGTFTAAGVDLDTSVNAIQGIANLAAVSGSNSQQASTAMYQLSQALATGTIRLMDWNSVVNAGMGGQVFQDALKETSRELNTGVDAAIKANGSFRESLKTGWLTSEVLTQTLKKFTTSGANEYVAKYTGLSIKAVKASLKNAEAQYGEADAVKMAAKELAKKSGKSEEEIRKTLEMAKTATDAATKVKTFTQLWDVMKEAAQSGWSKTWQIIVGDFEEAKDLLTPLADFFTNAIGKISDARNKLLEGALDNPFTNLVKRLDKVTASTKKVTKVMKDYGEVVDKVIGGEFGTGQERWDKLTKAGYDWAKVQNMVNEKLGNGTRHTEKLSEANEDLHESQGKTIDQLVKMSDSQLKSIGFTKSEIEAFRELEKQSDKTGIPIKKLIKNIDQLDGRTLLINSFKNIGKSIVAVFSSMSKAWKKVFPPMTEMQLYNIIAGLHKFSTYLKVDKEAADNFYRTFRGVFSLLKIVSILLSGPLKIGLKLFTSLLKAFNINALDLTASVGDTIYKFSKWLDSALDFTKVFKVLVPYVTGAAKAFSKFGKSIANVGAIKNTIKKIREEISKLKDIGLSEVGKNIIEGLKIGIKIDSNSICNAMKEIGIKILNSIKDILGIHSPSTEMIKIGEFTISGFIKGLQNGVSSLFDTIGKIVSGFIRKISDTLHNVSWSQLFSAGLSVGMLVIIKNLVDTIGKIASPLEGLGEVFKGAANVLNRSAERIGNVLKSFSKVLSAQAFNIRAKGIKEIAKSIAILVGCLIALSFIPSDKLWTSFEVLAAIVGVLAGMVALVEVLSILSSKVGAGTIKFGSLSIALIGISASLLLLGATVRIIGGMNAEKAENGINGVIKIIGALCGLLATYGLLVRGNAARNIDGAGKTILKLSFSLLILVGVMKLIAGMTWPELEKATFGMLGLLGFITAFMRISTIPGREIDNVGKNLVKIAGAMLILVATAKLIASMSWGDMGKAAVGMLGLLGIVALLMVISMIPGKNIDNIGNSLSKIAGSMVLLAITAKIISSMSWGDMGKAAVGLLGLSAIIAGLIYATNLASDKELKRVGSTLLMMSVAIGILAIVSTILGMIPIENLAKGVIAVGFLSSMMALMIAATKNADDCKGNIMAMSVAIAVMAVSVTALSFIKPDKLAGATAAMTLLMGMFALMAKASSTLKGAMGSLIVMTLAIGLMVGALYLIAQLPIESALGAAASLSILMLSMSASLALVSVAGSNAMTALTGVLALTAMAIPLLAFVGVLSLMQNIQNATSNALALSLLAGALTVMLMPLTLVGTFAAQALFGVLALTAMAIPLLAFVGVLSLMQNIQNATSNALLLIVLMNTMTNTLTKISLIAPLAILGLSAVAGLSSLIVGLGGLLAVVGALTTKFPNLEKFIDAGLPLLEKLSYGIGSMIGNLVSGFANGVASGLPSIATTLSQFMLNLMPFIVGASTIDPSMTKGIESIVKAVLLLTASEMVQGIAAFVTGESPLESFGKQLVTFGEAMVEFSRIVSGNIDEGAVTAAANAGKTLAKMQMTLSGTSGVIQFFSGEKDLSVFASQIKIFGKAIVSFSKTVSGNINEDAVTSAANAGKTLVELQKTLPGTSGVVQFFSGEKDLSVFANQIKIFGKAIVSFSKTVTGKINEDAVTSAANAGKTLVELQKTLPRTNGVVQFFSGEKNLDTFGKSIKSFGKAIVSFSKTVSGNINEGAITAAANAGTVMALLQKSVPKSGGLKGLIFGDNTLSKFGKSLKKFGESIVEFSDEVKGINISSVNSAVAACSAIITLVKSTSGLKYDGLSSFANNLDKIVTSSVNNFINAFSSSTSRVYSAGKNMTANLAKGIYSGSSAINRSITPIINNMVRIAQSKQSTFLSIGRNMMIRFGTGIRQGGNMATSLFLSTLSTCIARAKDKYQSFYSSGSYLAEGLRDGMESKRTSLYNEGVSLAKSANKGFTEYEDIHSPSKKWYGFGGYMLQGLINALGDGEKDVSKASANVGKKSTKSLSSALSKVSDLLNLDVDSQPTIRPVVDLSDVTDSANAINGMFSMSPSVGDLPDMRGISSMINNIQNGNDNSDLISAVEGLRDDLSSGSSINVEVNLDYNAGEDAATIANDIATSLRRAIRRG